MWTYDVQEAYCCVLGDVVFVIFVAMFFFFGIFPLLLLNERDLDARWMYVLKLPAS